MKPRKPQHSHNPARRSLLDEMQITNEEIARRKEFLEFHDEDVARLKSLNEFAQKYADYVIEDLYRHFLAFDETRMFFQDPKVLERVKQMQKQYFLQLTQGNYNTEYIENRLKVGAAHASINLDVKWYLGGYNFYLRAVMARLLKAYQKDSERAITTFLSLMKLVFLDVSLAIDTYIFERERTIRLQQETLARQAQELAVFQERGLIAREIHDGVAQSLAYLNLKTKGLEDLLTTKDKEQALSELNHIREVIKETYEDVRELLADFRTKFKEGKGLFEALDRYIKDFSQRTGIRAHLIRSNSSVALSPAAQVQVFRMIQEALTNVRKHASAKEVKVALSTAPTLLEIKIQDDGRGFNPRELSNQMNLHWGLEIMRERAAHLQGTLQLESEPGRGTTLHIKIPVESSKG